MPKDKRVFAPFPIEMDEHPKIIGLSDRAFRALVESTFYSRRMLTDGFVDERVVKARWGAEAAAELASNDPERPSWIRVDGGWQIHDFLDFHPSRAEIEANREGTSEKRSEAGKVGAAARWGRRDGGKPDSKSDGNRTESHADRIASDGSGMASDGSETETETSTTPNGVGARKRGTRIPDEFFITKDMHEWAAREVPGLDVRASTRKFVDYWRAESGAKASKKDWVSAWRFWMRRDHERLPAAKVSPAMRAAQTALQIEALEQERGQIGA